MYLIGNTIELRQKEALGSYVKIKLTPQTHESKKKAALLLCAPSNKFKFCIKKQPFRTIISYHTKCI